MGAEAERARTLRDWARFERRRGSNADPGASMWQEAREIFSRLKMRRELERMSEEYEAGASEMPDAKI